MLATITIPPCSARTVTLRQGEKLRVIDCEGSQVADLVAFLRDDPTDALSQNMTRMNQHKVGLQVGDTLYSGLNRPLLTVSADTVGVHDLLFAPCNQFYYGHQFGLPDKTGCREHLALALAEFGIGIAAVTDPLNVFMHTEIEAETGRMVILPPISKAGDFLELTAQHDLIVAVSACAADVTDCNSGECTGIELRVAS